MVVNRSDDPRMRLASIDVFTEYRLLVEDRYPDVFVLAAEVPEEEPAPPRSRPRSKVRHRRRVR